MGYILHFMFILTERFGKMELYLIRHGQSVNNVINDGKNRLPDPPLTELGYQQAEIVSQHLLNAIKIVRETPESATLVSKPKYRISKLYCSPMLRALQTAQPISKELGLAPEVWVNSHEYGGIFMYEENGTVGLPGKTRSEILAQFPHYVLPKEISEQGWWHSNKEEWSSCHGRAIKVASQLLEWTEQDERIAMVTHGGFMDALLKALFNQLPGRDVYYHHFNTAITHLTFDPARRRINLLYLNRVDHLSAEYVS